MDLCVQKGLFFLSYSILGTVLQERISGVGQNRLFLILNTPKIGYNVQKILQDCLNKRPIWSIITIRYLLHWLFKIYYRRRVLPPKVATGSNAQLYHSAIASWYNNRFAVIIQKF